MVSSSNNLHSFLLFFFFFSRHQIQNSPELVTEDFRIFLFCISVVSLFMEIMEEEGR